MRLSTCVYSTSYIQRHVGQARPYRTCAFCNQAESVTVVARAYLASDSYEMLQDDLLAIPEGSHVRPETSQRSSTKLTISWQFYNLFRPQGSIESSQQGRTTSLLTKAGFVLISLMRIERSERTIFDASFENERRKHSLCAAVSAMQQTIRQA